MDGGRERSPVASRPNVPEKRSDSAAPVPVREGDSPGEYVGGRSPTGTMPVRERDSSGECVGGQSPTGTLMFGFGDTSGKPKPKRPPKDPRRE